MNIKPKSKLNSAIVETTEDWMVDKECILKKVVQYTYEKKNK